MKKLIPADTVDTAGNVWETVMTGERAQGRVAPPPETYSDVASIRMWKRVS